MSSNTDVNKVALPAGEFERVFQKANVLTDGLANAKSAKSKATKMGNFLAPHVGREVAINVNGRTGKAKLCMTQGRAKQKLYYFEVRWDDPHAAPESPPTETNAGVKLDDGLDSPTVDGTGAGDQPVDMQELGDQQQAGILAGNTEEW